MSIEIRAPKTGEATNFWAELAQNILEQSALTNFLY